jgi:tetratricopeptide (TPR) repeat protein
VNPHETVLPAAAEPGNPSEIELARALDAYMTAAEAGQSPDPEKLMAEHPAVADRLRACLASLRLVERAAGSFAAGAADGGSVGLERPEVLGDFRIIREVGRGGMGVVYEAEQVSLGRRVALKVLPFTATMDPRQLQRFHNEARAAAGLHHTNIVPVYAVGCERGVHYYAMQFIDGRTLADVIAHQRREGGQQLPRPPAAEAAAASTSTAPPAAQATSATPRDAAYFRRAAEWGIQAAEALDCAHSLGVVHRDVKPGNLLVDGGGRLWVTDFGLAQVQSDARLTLTGDLVGTLRYMSPEQALAKRVVIDHRTDVYSLGATLYELLTLEPAYSGSDRQELLRQIAFEEPRPLRRINKAIPGELETIILKALEKNPVERYGTAQELADDLRRWLDDRPIRARRPSLMQRLRKWGRRHRAAVAAAAVVLVLGSAMLAGSVGWQAHGWEARREQTAQAVAQALDEAALWQQQRRLPEALSAVRRADGLVRGGTADEALRRHVQARRADLELLEALDNARLEGTAERDGHFDHERANGLYEEAFRAAGLDIEGLPTEEAAERLRLTTVAAELAAALDHWAMLRWLIRGTGDTTWQHLLAVARAADPDGMAARVRDALRTKDRRALLDLAASEEARDLLPPTLQALATDLTQADALGAAEALLREARRRHPDDFWINEQLGLFLMGPRFPRPDEAIVYCTAAVSLRPDSPGAHLNLGNILRDRGDMDEAIKEYQQALRLKKDYSDAHNDLGFALIAKGDVDRAIKEYLEALRLKKDDLVAHLNLGCALSDRGDVDGAIKEFQEALRLKKDDPKAHYNLGNSLQAKGDVDGAIKEWQEALRLNKDFREAHDNLGKALLDKGDVSGAIDECHAALRLKKEDADAHNTLGVALIAKGDIDGAIEECREALRLKKDYPEAHGSLGNALRIKGDVEGAISECQEALRLKKDLPWAHGNLGNALFDKRDVDGAIKEYQEALRLKKDDPITHSNLGSAVLAKGDVDGAIKECLEALRLKKDFPDAHNNLGSALLAKGDVDGAIKEYQEALRLKSDFAEAHGGLGSALGQKGDADGAIKECREALRLRKDYPIVHYNLGRALHHKSQLDEAIAQYQEAIRLKKDYPDAHCNLGAALYDKGQLDQAIAEYREAIRLKKDDPKAHYNLGIALAHQRQLDEAIRAYEAAIQINPTYAEAYCNLGDVLRQQGRFAESLAAYKRGHELSSRKPGWRFPSAQWVRQAEQLARLDERLSDILQGKARPKDAAERLALAEFCQLHRKQYAAAARFYGEAFAGRPDLSDDLGAAYRYNAACAAALAGCRQGQDAAGLDEQERSRLRRQAHDWLQADLRAWRNLLEQYPAKVSSDAVKQLRHWLEDIDFAGVRGPEGLAKLPEAERQPWQQLWADVGDALARAQGKTAPEKKPDAK